MQKIQHDSGDEDKETRLKNRSDQLGEHLTIYQKNLQKKEKKDLQKRVETKGTSQAIKLSSEFVAGIVIGCILGLGFDYFFKTTPWGLIVFLILGFCAGVLNVLRVAGRVGPSAFDKMKAPSLKEQQKKTFKDEN